MSEGQKETITVPEEVKQILELVSFKARDSDYIDEKSGVSARLSISARENLVSAAERRMYVNGDSNTVVRLTDFWGVVPAITGKVELVYEGEQMGVYEVAIDLIDKAIKDLFLERFPDPNRTVKMDDKDPYGVIKAFFAGGNVVDLLNDDSEEIYKAKLDDIQGLDKLIKKYASDT